MARGCLSCIHYPLPAQSRMVGMCFIKTLTIGACYGYYFTMDRLEISLCRAVFATVEGIDQYVV